MDKRTYRLPGTVASTMILWLSLLYVLPAEAHNGAVALAVPIEGIVVDGDLSDWPEDMRRYAVALLSGWRSSEGSGGF